MLVKELIYSILDRVKIVSDDSIITEEHVLFLCKKYRSFLIKKEKEKNKGASDESAEFETQQICLDVEKTPAIDGEPCTGGHYLKTTQKIPKIVDGEQPVVTPIDYFQGTNISYISRDRFRYVGTNPYLQNIIYVALGPDKHLYIKSNNPQFFYLKKIRLNAVFEDFEEADALACDSNGESTACTDILDLEFPIRDYLVPSLMELVIKDILGAAYRPSDDYNNAADDLSDIMAFIRRNTKSSLQKQIED